jgi:phosphoglycolate phosphatase-like HAD superfamily hydrolase
MFEKETSEYEINGQSSKDSVKNETAPDFSAVQILLWDIDGTLMRSTVRGGYKKYFAATMEKVFGSAGNLEAITPSGMTDTQIMFEALREDGITPEKILSEKDTILEIFKIEMSAVLEKNGEPYEILPGAREILEETGKNPNLINALLTGNLSVAAEIKLKSVGLWQYFENSPNAFGEISHNRNDLAVEAGKLFNEKYDFKFNPQQFIVIGDTPNDILCARHFGAKVIAVATGRNQTTEKLSACSPDAILDNFKDASKFLELLKKI